MSKYPYRLKKIRVDSDASVTDGEMTTIIEDCHQFCIWRVSDTEIHFEKVKADGSPQMVSSRLPPGIAGGVHISRVRDFQMYRPGETIPWPDHVTPPAVVDSNDAMLSALTAPAKPKQGKQTGLGV